MQIDLHTTSARRRAAAALMAGPAVIVAGMATTTWESEQTTAAYQAALASTPTKSQVAALLLVLGYALMGLAAIAVLAYARRAPRGLRIAAGVLAFFGATFLPGMVTVDFYDLAVATSLPADQAVEVADKAQSYGLLALASVPGIAGLVLGSVLLGACAWRARLVGAWVPALILAGLVGSFAAFSAASMIAGTALMAVAFAGIARGVLRHGEDAPARPVAVAPVAVTA